MARKPTQTTAVIDWEKEMETQAKLAADQQRSVGGVSRSFSTKAGILSFDGEPCVGNRVCAIVIADILENKFFDKPFVEGVPTPPVCFAFGKDENDMEPHIAVDNDPYFQRQHSQCTGCPNNEWGSATVGRGKACANSQRLSLIMAGTFVETGRGRTKELKLEELFTDPEHFEKAEVGNLGLPVTSVKNFSTYVKTLSAELRRPPHGVYTEIWIEPHPKFQFQVCFEAIDKVPNDLLQVIMERHRKEQELVGQPYSAPLEEEAAEPAKANNKLRGKTKR